MTALVADASALVELLRASPLADRVAARIAVEGARLHLPHVAGAEVAHALRGMLRGSKIVAAGADSALSLFLGLAAVRHPIEPFLPRIWQLRDNLTVYDATYVTIAEALQIPLVTCDAKFDTPAVTRLIDVEVVR